jgi:RNA polymerase sigma-70 factor (ECF subfamily)
MDVGIADLRAGYYTGAESDLKGRQSVDQSGLNRFLASVERRAFLMAVASLKDQEDALDVVQDTMMMLAKRYGQKSEEEWRPLFFKILNNRIRDVIRRRTVKNRFAGFLTVFSRDESVDAPDPFQLVADDSGNTPVQLIEQEETWAAVSLAVSELPRRQQEAFLLRCIEGMSTEETATAMGCSQGSVKTHYSRALQALQAMLGEFRQ